MGKEKISELHFGDKFITQLGEFTVIEKMQNDTIKVASCDYYGDYLGKFSSSIIPDYDTSNIRGYIEEKILPKFEDYFGDNLEDCDLKNGYRMRAISSEECLLFSSHYGHPISKECWTSTVTQDGGKVYYFNNYGVIKSCEPHKNFKRIMIVFGLNKDTFVEKIKKEIGLVKAKI